jgi:membrane fusion protein (multidrug efflux system)
MSSEAEKNQKKKINLKVYIPMTLIILVVLSGAIYWYVQYMKYISTDDAVIESDNVSLSSKILGRIVKLHADEGDSVKNGQLLIELDSTDLTAQKQQAEAFIRQAGSLVAQSQAKLQSDNGGIKVLQINADKAKSDFDRAVKQKDAGVITQEQFENIRKNLLSANAQLDAAQIQLKVSDSQIASAKASVDNAVAQANVIKTQLKNTKIYSPFNGIIAKRWLLPGDMAQPGQTVLTVNNNRKYWVSVYIEETKLDHIRIGQKAIFTIDAYPDYEFTGRVYDIGNNTAARFSLIPPNNAAGNFTKITQRVQIKVEIENVNGGKKTSNFTFYSGMSVEMKLVK